MKIFAYYDLDGNIQSLIGVEAAEGAFAMRAPRPGQFAAEINIEGLALEAKAGDPEALVEIAEKYKVITPVAGLKLVRKER